MWKRALRRCGSALVVRPTMVDVRDHMKKLATFSVVGAFLVFSAFLALAGRAPAPIDCQMVRWAGPTADPMPVVRRPPGAKFTLRVIEVPVCPRPK
jgi:hypothetical protein